MALFGKKGGRAVSRAGSTQKMEIDPDLQFESAALLLKAKKWEDAVKAYTALAEKYPDRKAQCEAGIAEAKKGLAG